MKRKTKPRKQIPALRSARYTKTLIVGHALSEYESVSYLLHSHGMHNAKPLKRENILPQEISLLLPQTKQEEQSSEQLQVSPVWHGLALDLFLSNPSSQWWGWSDSNAVNFLDYWKSIEPSIGFVLAYNTPENYLKNLYQTNIKISKETLEKGLKEWYDYNQTLLKFFYRNGMCTLLVNTQEVQKDKQNYLKKVSQHTGVPLKKSSQVNALTKVKEVKNLPLEYFIDEILEGHPEITDLFAELQSVASLPYITPKKKKKNPRKSLNAFFKETSVLRHQLDHTKEELKNYYLEKQEALLVSEAKISEETRKIHSEEKFKLEQSFVDKEKKLLATTQNTQEENALLLSQLHQVQEELEKLYLKSEAEKNSSEQLKVDKVQLLSQKNTLEKQLFESGETFTKEQINLKQEKENQTKTVQELKKKNTQISQIKREKEEENTLLIAQLHQVQEELEKYYLENKTLKEAREEATLYYGAAERIKNQLGYQLGANMIIKSKSFFGIVGLPFSLSKIARIYKKEQKIKNEQDKLPPIHTYADAYDAERIKGHLSYMLGQTMIETMKKPFGIFILPFRISATLKAFKTSRV